MFVDKAVLVTLACCILYKYYELKRKRMPLLVDVKLQLDSRVRFYIGRMELPHKGVVAKDKKDHERGVVQFMDRT